MGKVDPALLLLPRGTTYLVFTLPWYGLLVVRAEGGDIHARLRYSCAYTVAFYRRGRKKSETTFKLRTLIKLSSGCGM